MTRRSTGTPATTALTRAGVAFTLHSYEHDPRAEHYGLEGARALGVEPGRAFKTLVVELDDDPRRLVTAVIGSDRLLDLKATAAAAGGKHAALASPGLAQRATGFVVGGISPFGQKRRMRTFIDASAMGYETVFVSAGRRGLSVELSPAALVTATRGTLAGLTR